MNSANLEKAEYIAELSILNFQRSILSTLLNFGSRIVEFLKCLTFIQSNFMFKVAKGHATQRVKLFFPLHHYFILHLLYMNRYLWIDMAFG